MDTLLSSLGRGLQLELNRGEIAQRRVQSLPTIRDFDVFKHLPVRFARWAKAVQAQLALEGAEKTLLGGRCSNSPLCGTYWESYHARWAGPDSMDTVE